MGNTHEQGTKQRDSFQANMKPAAAKALEATEKPAGLEVLRMGEQLDKAGMTAV